jgi:hypothetical protein
MGGRQGEGDGLKRENWLWALRLGAVVVLMVGWIVSVL